MGIPGFVGQFLKRKRYKNTILNRLPIVPQELWFDLNGLIHASAGQVYAYGRTENKDDEQKMLERRQAIKSLSDAELEQQFLDKIIDNIVLYINMFSPTGTIVIAVDGVAPAAKINQQRQRRYKASKTPMKDIRFNPSSITPGTDIMFKIDETIKKWIADNYLKLPPQIIYSNHLVLGEGEHKIFDLVRRGLIGKGSVVLIGLDADLIMLSLVSNVRNLYLSRENRDDIINIDSFRENLQAELLTGSAVEDFVLMSFLVGNDFLPHQPAAEEILEFYDRMFTAYKTIRSGIINEGVINWKSFTKFITNLSREEERLLESIAAKNTVFPNQVLALSFILAEYPGGASFRKFSYRHFRGYWYSKVLSPKGNTEILTDKLKMDFGANQDKVTKMCENYLTTLAWNYAYYTEGHTEVNPEHLYYYNYTPLLSDLALVMADSPGNLTEYKTFEGAIYFTPLHQLITVIPLKSIDVLPAVLLPYTEYDSPLYDLFITDFTVDLSGKDKEELGLAILPPIDIKYIYNNLQIDLNTLSKYLPRAEIQYSQGQYNEFFRAQREFYQSLKSAKEGGFRGGRGRGESRGGRGSGGRGRGRGGSIGGGNAQGGRGSSRGRGSRGGYRGSRGGISAYQNQ